MEQVAKQEQAPLSLPEQVQLEAGIIFNHAPARTAPSVPPRSAPDAPLVEDSVDSLSEQQPTKRKAEGQTFILFGYYFAIIWLLISNYLAIIWLLVGYDLAMI